MRLRGSGKRANPNEDQMDEWRLLADQFGLPYYMIHERYLAPGEPVDHERMVCTRFLEKCCAKARQNTCNRIHWTECQLSRVMLQQGYLNADVSREIIKYGVRSTGEIMALSRANKLPDWFTESSHWMDFYDYLLAEDPAARTTHNDPLPDSEDALDLLLHARRQDLADRASGSSIQPVCKKRPKFLQPTPKSRTKTAKSRIKTAKTAVCFFCSDRVRSQMLTRRHVQTAAIFHIFSKRCGNNKARRLLSGVNRTF